MCAPCVPGLPDAGKAGGGDQTTRWDRELPRVQGGGKSKGVGDTGVEAMGGRPGAGNEGRQAAAGGQRAPPAPCGKSPREAAARALALPARRPPRGTRRRRRRLLPAHGPASRQHAAARLVPAVRRRPPGRSEEPGEGAGGRREASVTAAAERRQEADPAAS